MNIIGLQQGKWTQNLLSAAKVLGLLLVVIIGLTAIPNSATPVESASSGTWGLAMVFVLLSYGGWNEAAYIFAEIQDGRRNWCDENCFQRFKIIKYLFFNFKFPPIGVDSSSLKFTKE